MAKLANPVALPSPEVEGSEHRFSRPRAPFVTAELYPGIEAAELASPHDSGAFAIRLEKGSREWSIRSVAL